MYRADVGRNGASQEKRMTYEYECDDGHEFDVEQGILDEPLTTCEEAVPDGGLPCDGIRPCGAPCRRVIRTPRVFCLRGYGWSKDGYG